MEFTDDARPPQYADYERTRLEVGHQNPWGKRVSETILHTIHPSRPQSVNWCQARVSVRFGQAGHASSGHARITGLLPRPFEVPS